MFRNLIDGIINFPPSAIILVLVHCAALVWALRRKDIRPVLLLNAALAAVILGYNARFISGAYGYDDWLLVLVAIALINLIASGAALAGFRVPRAIIWVGFGIILALSVLLVAFTFMFKFDRLV
jgi:hypothetical protein